MQTEKTISKIEDSNGEIALVGYTLAPIEGYPKNGEHMQVYTDLPCSIMKGLDNFKQKNKWYVTFYENINIPEKTYNTANEAIRGAKENYLRYLKKQIKNIEAGVLK